MLTRSALTLLWNNEICRNFNNGTHGGFSSMDIVRMATLFQCIVSRSHVCLSHQVNPQEFVYFLGYCGLGHPCIRAIVFGHVPVWLFMDFEYGPI